MDFYNIYTAVFCSIISIIIQEIRKDSLSIYYILLQGFYKTKCMKKLGR
jgi:hypothetical protein